MEAHNRVAVEVFCYSNDTKIDHMTERFRAAADHWRTIADLSDDDASALIAAEHRYPRRSFWAYGSQSFAFICPSGRARSGFLVGISRDDRPPGDRLSYHG